MRAVFGAVLLALVGCSSALPAPIIGQLSPPLVCGSGTLPISLSGEHFLAQPVSTLSGKTVLEVPSATLIPPSGSSLFPDVTWISSELLSLRVPLDLLGAGPYSVELIDPDGQRARRDNLLTHQEVDVLIASVPDPVCVADGDRHLQLAGTGFDPAAVVSVRDASGAIVLQPSASITAGSVDLTLPTGSLQPGSYTLVIENPEQGGCPATAAQPLTIDAPPTLHSADPDQVCASGARLTLTGSGLVAGAVVELRDPASGTTVAATDVDVSAPDSALVIFGANTLPKNQKLDVVWHNADGCSADLAGSVHVKSGGGTCN